MITPELVSYVRGEKAKGVSDESLKAALLAAGWSSSDLEEAFKAANSPASGAPFSPAAHHLSGSKKGLISAVLVLLVLIGGAVAYSFGYLGSFFSPREDAAAAMYKNVIEAESAEFDATFSLKVDIPEGAEASAVSSFLSSAGPGEIVLRMKGAYDKAGFEDKSRLDFSLKVAGLQAAAEIRVFGDILYAMLSEAPDLGFLDLSAYEGKWFSADAGGAQELFSSISLTADAKSYKLTAEEEDRLKDLAKTASFIKVLGKNGSEKIEGVDADRYLFDLDRPGIKDYFLKVAEFLRTSSVKDKFPEEMFRPEDVDEVLSMIEDFKGEVWVGEDSFPYKLTASFSTSIDEEENQEREAKIHVSMFVLFSGWNKPVEIEKPEGAEDLTEKISDDLETAQQKGRGASIKVNLYNLVTKAEIYYDGKNSYKGFCGSKEASENIEKINEAAGSQAAVCRDSARGYLFSSQVSPGLHYCISYSGGFRELSQTPAGLECE